MNEVIVTTAIYNLVMREKLMDFNNPNLKFNPNPYNNNYSNNNSNISSNNTILVVVVVVVVIAVLVL